MRLIITIIKQLDRKVEITYSRSPRIHQVSRTDTHRDHFHRSSVTTQFIHFTQKGGKRPRGTTTALVVLELEVQHCRLGWSQVMRCVTERRLSR